jgi:hypothetical protein
MLNMLVGPPSSSSPNAGPRELHAPILLLLRYELLVAFFSFPFRRSLSLSLLLESHQPNGKRSEEGDDPEGSRAGKEGK